MALEVTDKNINEILKAKDVTILDFWAPWCGPCRMVGPVIDALSHDYESNTRVSIGKINVDENPETALNYGVRGIPTVMFFKNGELIDKLVGAQSKGVYETKINSLL